MSKSKLNNRVVVLCALLVVVIFVAMYSITHNLKITTQRQNTMYTYICTLSKQVATLQHQLRKQQFILCDNIIDVQKVDRMLYHQENINHTFSLVIDEVMDKVERID